MADELTPAGATPSPSPTPTPPPTPTDVPSLVGAAPTPEVKPEDKPAEFVPHKAESFKLPEGFTADPQAMTKFTEIANKAKLPADVANELISLQAELSKQASEAGSAAFAEMQTKWQTEVRSDPEIGGAKLDANLGNIAKLLQKYDVPGVREAFTLTGAGNNPAIVKFLAKVAADLSESGPLAGAPGATAERTLAQVLYPNQGKS